MDAQMHSLRMFIWFAGAVVVGGSLVAVFA